MRELSSGDRVGRGAASWVLQALVVFALAFCARCSHAQASGALATNIVICGPVGLPGTTYVSAAGHPVSCGTDANGNGLVLQMSQQFVAMNVNDTTDDGGTAAGVAVGGAVFSVLGVAFGFRLLRNFVNSSPEG